MVSAEVDCAKSDEKDEVLLEDEEEGGVNESQLSPVEDNDGNGGGREDEGEGDVLQALLSKERRGSGSSWSGWTDSWSLECLGPLVIAFETAAETAAAVS